MNSVHCIRPGPGGHHCGRSGGSSGGGSGGGSGGSNSGGGSSGGSGGGSSGGGGDDDDWGSSSGGGGNSGGGNGDDDGAGSFADDQWNADGWESSNLDNGGTMTGGVKVGSSETMNIWPFIVGALVATVVGTAFVASRVSVARLLCLRVSLRLSVSHPSPLLWFCQAEALRRGGAAPSPRGISEEADEALQRLPAAERRVPRRSYCWWRHHPGLH